MTRVASGQQRDWRAWCNLADAAARAGRWADAAAALQQASALNPKDAAVARNYAAALSNVGRLEEALAAFETAVALDPVDVRGRLAYARLLIDIGQPREAMEQIDQGARLSLAQLLPNDEQAPAISPDRLADVRDIALLQDRLNKVDDLRRLLEATREAGIAPDVLGSLWASLAFREGRTEEARTLLLQDSGRFDDAHWDRLMTKVADALGDADAAFAAAEAMNRAVPGYDEWRRRAAHYRSQIRMTAEIVTPDWASRIPTADTDDGLADPIFIVGFPRSGTTLLDTFLMGHPDTFVVEEGRMLELATGVVSESPGLDWPQEIVTRARKVYADELATHLPPNFSGVVVDKHPLNMLRLAVLHALFPGAKVLFAQRHPCDTVLSGFMQSFRLNHAMASFLDLADAADLYDASMEMWTRSLGAIPQAVHTVVYERLTEDPAAELRTALEFVGLEWRDELLDHQATAKSRGLITTASYDQVVQPLNSKASGRWRRYRQHMEPVLPVLLPWAQRLGYAD